MILQTQAEARVERTCLVLALLSILLKVFAIGCVFTVGIFVFIYELEVPVLFWFALGAHAISIVIHNIAQSVRSRAIRMAIWNPRYFE